MNGREWPGGLRVSSEASATALRNVVGEVGLSERELKMEIFKNKSNHQITSVIY